MRYTIIKVLKQCCLFYFIVLFGGFSMTGKNYLIEKLKQDGLSFKPPIWLRDGRKGFYPNTYSIKTARKLDTMEKARKVGRRIPTPIRIHPALIKVG